MSWKWEFGFLMLGVSVLNFYAGKKIADGKYRKVWLAVGLSTSLLPLLYYKYGNFLLDTVSDAATLFGTSLNTPELAVILPVGISFFTFQAMSYTIDIYRKNSVPEPSPVKFLTFVAFFPQLVAGPIERSNHIIPQFDRIKRFEIDEFIAGMRLFIWGLFKKVVIADRLSMYVDPVFNNPDMYAGPTYVLATVLFTFQIYCDFSGYSDMAIGIARTFGFKLMQNFNLPYLARSIGDFWKRWHISLSTWFGDYLYIPLGGNRVSIPRWVFNISVVFLVSGLWHGASWTFIIWGALHASFYLIEYLGDLTLKGLRIASIKKIRFYKFIRILITFALVSFAWIFFRANSVEEAFQIAGGITQLSGNLWWGASAFSTVIALLLVIFLVIVQFLQYTEVFSMYYKTGKVANWAVSIGYVFLLLGIALLGVSSNAFIYFQF
jgi:D-alanyl-lipoteichoic acid acyltransferase DltB (MBOAT superfamily)